MKYLWYTRCMKQNGDRIDAARPTIWLYMLCSRYSIWYYHMIIHALQTVLHLIFVWCTITVYTINYSEYFQYKWSTRLQSINNHMVGRAASVVSSLLFHAPCIVYIRQITSLGLKTWSAKDSVLSIIIMSNLKTVWNSFKKKENNSAEKESFSLSLFPFP